MPLPDQTPRLPKWPFLLGDAALLVIAWIIARNVHNAFAGTPLVLIVACVFAAALLGAVPFLADYARKQDEALDERQRALESLARTISGSAEQISIAANGLNAIAELTQKTLRHAEHVPQKLHEKIAEFQAQLANANDAEKEEMEKELTELRAADSERLEAVADKIAKSTAEWAKLEAATQKHFAAATAALDEKLAALDAKLAALDAAAKNLAAVPLSAPTPPPAEHKPEPAAPSPAAETTEASAKPEGTAHPPKRPRKPRREETVAEEPAAPPAAEAPPPPAVAAPPASEPPPIPAEKIPEVAPITPKTAEPFSAAAPVEPPAAAEAAAEPPKPAKKRAPKKPAPPEGEPSLGLDETPAPPPAAEMGERAVSSDGATRLLVTAYIGIGNRLFIRGEGPGLSWDKGVPLQFVSIGKWRWETTTASAPVKFKLYKNDETECAALGTQSLDPGQQQEVTAAF